MTDAEKLLSIESVAAIHVNRKFAQYDDMVKYTEYLNITNQLMSSFKKGDLVLINPINKKERSANMIVISLAQEDVPPISECWLISDAELRKWERKQGEVLNVERDDFCKNSSPDLCKINKIKLIGFLEAFDIINARFQQASIEEFIAWVFQEEIRCYTENYTRFEIYFIAHCKREELGCRGKLYNFMLQTFYIKNDILNFDPGLLPNSLGRWITYNQLIDRWKEKQHKYGYFRELKELITSYLSNSSEIPDIDISGPPTLLAYYPIDGITRDIEKAVFNLYQVELTEAKIFINNAQAALTLGQRLRDEIEKISNGFNHGNKPGSRLLIIKCMLDTIGIIDAKFDRHSMPGNPKDFLEFCRKLSPKLFSISVDSFKDLCKKGSNKMKRVCTWGAGVKPNSAYWNDILHKINI